jgi:hypothetical protein
MCQVTPELLKQPTDEPAAEQLAHVINFLMNAAATF